MNRMRFPAEPTPGRVHMLPDHHPVPNTEVPATLGGEGIAAGHRKGNDAQVKGLGIMRSGKDSPGPLNNQICSAGMKPLGGLVGTHPGSALTWSCRICLAEMSTLAVDGTGYCGRDKGFTLQQSGYLEADVGIWSPPSLPSVGSGKVTGSTSSQLMGEGLGKRC